MFFLILPKKSNLHFKKLDFLRNGVEINSIFILMFIQSQKSKRPELRIFPVLLSTLF
jgi:hypothetical protein